MPLYDYSCEDCGPFRDWQAMSAFTALIECPTCGGPAPRAITAPFIANMNPHSRIAHQRNEKSADAPEVMNRKEMDRLGAKRAGARGGHGDAPGRHGHAHSHGHGHSGRPWMIGH